MQTLAVKMVPEELYLLFSLLLIPIGLAAQGYFWLVTKPTEQTAMHPPELFAVYFCAAFVSTWHYLAFAVCAFVALGLALRRSDIRRYVQTNSWYWLWFLLYVCGVTATGYAVHRLGWSSAVVVVVALVLVALGKQGHSQHAPQNG